VSPRSVWNEDRGSANCVSRRGQEMARHPGEGERGNRDLELCHCTNTQSKKERMKDKSEKKRCDEM